MQQVEDDDRVVTAAMTLDFSDPPCPPSQDLLLWGAASFVFRLPCMFSGILGPPNGENDPFSA